MMMPRIVKALAAAALVLFARAAAAQGVDELVRRADHVLRGQTTAAVLHMDVHTRAYDRRYAIVYWEDARGPQDRVLVKILGPALYRGHGTLKVGDRLTVYDPSTDRMTVLSSSMLGESWMGSHFDNDDFVKGTDLARDYTSRETGARAGAAPDGGAATFHDLELRPRPVAPVAWDHIELHLYVEGGAVVPTQMQYFQHAGDRAPWRTLTFSDAKNIAGRFAPTVMTMTVTSKPGEYTRLTYDEVRLDAPIPADKFTEQALRR